jgi:hypothetical protein
VPPRKRAGGPPSVVSAAAATVPAGAAEGQELTILDSLLPSLLPRAVAGDEQAIDRVLSVLELRLKYKRQRRAEED